MRRTAAVLAIAVSLALVGGACSSSGGSEKQAARSTSTSSTSTSTSSSTSSSSSTSTTAGAPGSTAAPRATAAPTPTTAAPNLGAAAVKLTQVGRFEQPLDLKWCAGHPDPFVVSKTGRILNTRTGQVILDVSGQVSTSGEQGLLGMSCSPNGDTLFVDYTSRDGREDRLDRYVMPPDGQPVDTGTVHNVLAVADPAPNHNGGNLVIGPDGMLWYGLGDGGGRDDQYHNAQNPDARLGKLLRIDVASNAVSMAALGLRNPWRFSFDRANGDLWIGDVGQDNIEEVDALPAGRILGANLGWPLYEGTNRYQAGSDPPNLVFPVFQYTHAEGQSVTGGYVYRGRAIPALRGAYVFADAYTGALRGLTAAGGRTTQHRFLGPKVSGLLSSFAEDPNGELYALSLGGTIFRIDPA